MFLSQLIGQIPRQSADHLLLSAKDGSICPKANTQARCQSQVAMTVCGLFVQLVSLNGLGSRFPMCISVLRLLACESGKNGPNQVSLKQITEGG